MYSLILLLVALLGLPVMSARAQTKGGVRVVAYIVSIHADSSGRAVQGTRRLDSADVEGVLADLRQHLGATIYFTWSGGPTQRRTPGQEALLARLRASGVRVELRTDSTFRSRVVPP